MSEIDELKKKIVKDAEQSQRRISELQQEVQEMVADRKKNREEFEEADQRYEGDISEAVNEITSIQSRMLTAQELLNFLETK
jgi:ribosome recycling factor